MDKSSQILNYILPLCKMWMSWNLRYWRCIVKVVVKFCSVWYFRAHDCGFRAKAVSHRRISLKAWPWVVSWTTGTGFRAGRAAIVGVVGRRRRGNKFWNGPIVLRTLLGSFFALKQKKSMGDRRLPVTIFRVFWLNRPWLTFVRSDWVYTFRWRRLGLKIMVFLKQKSGSIPWPPLQASKSIQFCLPVSGVGALNRP